MQLHFEEFPVFVTDHAAIRIKERGFSPIWIRQVLAKHRPFEKGVHKWVLPGNGDTIVYSDVKVAKGRRGRRRHVMTVFHDD